MLEDRPVEVYFHLGGVGSEAVLGAMRQGGLVVVSGDAELPQEIIVSVS